MVKKPDQASTEQAPDTDPNAVPPEGRPGEQAPAWIEALLEQVKAPDPDAIVQAYLARGAQPAAADPAAAELAELQRWRLGLEDRLHKAFGGKV